MSVTEVKKKIIFLPRQCAKEWLFVQEDILISISDTFIEAPEFTHEPTRLLKLQFHDYVSEAQEYQLKYRQMNYEQALEIAQFVNDNMDHQKIIIHCNYGRSRSRAVALALKNHSLFKDYEVWYQNAHKRLELASLEDFGNPRVFHLVFDALVEKETNFLI